MVLDFGFYNIDCIKGMKEFPDNYFELAIVDPPYQGNDAIGINNSRSHEANRKKYHLFENIAPDKSYFDELFRVSKNQIVWGANFFDDPRLRGGVFAGIKKGRLLGGLNLPAIQRVKQLISLSIAGMVCYKKT